MDKFVRDFYPTWENILYIDKYLCMSSILNYLNFFESWNKKGIAFGVCINCRDINVYRKYAIKTEAMYT